MAISALGRENEIAASCLSMLFRSATAAAPRGRMDFPGLAVFEFSEAFLKAHLGPGQAGNLVAPTAGKGPLARNVQRLWIDTLLLEFILTSAHRQKVTIGDRPWIDNFPNHREFFCQSFLHATNADCAMPIRSAFSCFGGVSCCEHAPSHRTGNPQIILAA